MSVETKTLSKEISEIFWREGYTLATAESCTAGNVAAIITAIQVVLVSIKVGLLPTQMR